MPRPQGSSSLLASVLTPKTIITFSFGMMTATCVLMSSALLRAPMDSTKYHAPAAAEAVSSLLRTDGIDAGKYTHAGSVRIPSRLEEDGSLVGLALEERLRLLELKVNARANWMDNPRMASTETVVCQKYQNMGDMKVCLDNIKKNDCIVYDFGLREQPEFGIFFAEEWGCEVHGFDPSPISIAYFQDTTRANSKIANGLSNYHFHPIGAGGIDGDLRLYEYNWGQISSIHYPYYLDRDNCSPRAEGPSDEEKKFGVPICKSIDPSSFQKSFTIPVRTLGSVMKKLGHTHIDVLKLDVEGSEYAFLEEAFDTMGCLPVDQVAMEFHHHRLDPRYGGGSAPELNALAVQMEVCDMDLFYVRNANGGHCDGHKWWKNAGLEFRYQHVSFAKGLSAKPPLKGKPVPGWEL